jgi:hypothetical protein
MSELVGARYSYHAIRSTTTTDRNNGVEGQAAIAWYRYPPSSYSGKEYNGHEEAGDEDVGVCAEMEEEPTSKALRGRLARCTSHGIFVFQDSFHL